MMANYNGDDYLHIRNCEGLLFCWGFWVFVPQACLILKAVLLPQSPKCWDCRYELPHPAHILCYTHFFLLCSAAARIWGCFFMATRWFPGNLVSLLELLLSLLKECKNELKWRPQDSLLKFTKRTGWAAAWGREWWREYTYRCLPHGNHEWGRGP